MSNYYPKYIPDSGPLGAPILLVGESPGETEHEKGLPFVGPSGDKLLSCLANHGVQRDDIRLANLFHYRPYDNKFESIEGTPALQDGINELRDYILQNRPVVIGALGAQPLKYLTGKDGIFKWRGSILPCIFDPTIKVIATHHPSAVLREAKLYPIFSLNLKRIISDSNFRDFKLPVREYICNPTGLELEKWTQELCKADTLAIDIETVKRSTHILCVGFAPSPDIGICIVPNTEGRRAIQRILSSRAKKIFQFGTFDTTQLRINDYEINDPYGQRHGRVYYWDTLVAGHVQAPELPLSLEFFTSIYTREPYYKTAGRGSIPDDTKGWDERFDRSSLYEYNARDCCVTFETYLAQRSRIINDPNLLDTFDFDMSVLGTQMDISDAGMLIDKERRDLLRDVLFLKWAKKQLILDQLVGEEVNVRSPDLKRILYDKDHLGLPTRRNHDGSITTDEDAIVSLISFCKDKIESLKTEESKWIWTKKQTVCSLILEIRGVRQILSNYLVETDKQRRLGSDGRLRSTYKHGPETGRWAASKYVDGSGLNAMTLPRDPIEVSEKELEDLRNLTIDTELMDIIVEDIKEIEEAA